MLKVVFAFLVFFFLLPAFARDEWKPKYSWEYENERTKNDYITREEFKRKLDEVKYPHGYGKTWYYSAGKNSPRFVYGEDWYAVIDNKNE